MAQLTPLDAADVAAIAAAYRLDIASLRPLWAGTINSNFRLETEGGPLFLRINEGKIVDEVAYEAELVSHLAARGVPTPRPLPAADGRPFAAVGDKLLTLFPWVAGAHPEPPTPAQARHLGEALATLHTAGASFPSRRESRYSRQKIRARAAAIAAPPAEIASLVDEMGPALSREAAPGLRRGVIHGDLFPDNVLYTGESIALLDFEQASDGELVYDLAVCLLSWCWDGAAFIPSLARAMGAGYVALRPLDAVEEEALPEVCRFAALRFTVTRITDVELAPSASPELRRAKDYRDFVRRWRRLDELGDAGIRALLSGP